jgi:replication-associated recombination protein RarA
MRSLAEKYRPSQWSEVIGQEKVIGRIQALAKRGSLSGRAYWLSGQSGTGKTTIARLIAHDIADPFLIQEVDASALTIAQLKDLETESQLKGFGEHSGRAFIVNEAHGLRKDVIRQLLVTLERIPSHVAWLFTTTSEQQESLFEELADASPLLSRCIRLALTSQGLCKQFARRIQEIAMAEGLDGQDLAKYERMMKDENNNFRAGLQRVEAGEMIG